MLVYSFGALCQSYDVVRALLGAAHPVLDQTHLALPDMPVDGSACRWVGLSLLCLAY
jgi:hypothetical protein